MCAKTRLGPGRPPLGHFPEPIWLLFDCFWAPKRSQICKKTFHDLLNQFWTSFGATFGPKTKPRIHPKTGPELDQKRAPQGEGPKKPQSQPLGSNLLSLAHSNDLLNLRSLLSVRKRTPFRPKLAHDKQKYSQRL